MQPTPQEIPTYVHNHLTGVIIGYMTRNTPGSTCLGARRSPLVRFCVETTQRHVGNMAHEHYSSDALAINVTLDSMKNMAKREQNVVFTFVFII